MEGTTEAETQTEKLGMNDDDLIYGAMTKTNTICPEMLGTGSITGMKTMKPEYSYAVVATK